MDNNEGIVKLKDLLDGPPPFKFIPHCGQYFWKVKADLPLPRAPFTRYECVVCNHSESFFTCREIPVTFHHLVHDLLKEEHDLLQTEE